MDKSVSILKFFLGALGLVVALNLSLLLFKLSPISVTMGVAAGVGALVGGWFAKTVGRAPMRQERSLFLWLYGGTIAVIFALILVIPPGAPTVAGLIIFSVQALAYPAFAQFFLSGKRMDAFLRKHG